MEDSSIVVVATDIRRTRVIWPQHRVSRCSNVLMFHTRGKARFLWHRNRPDGNIFQVVYLSTKLAWNQKEKLWSPEKTIRLPRNWEDTQFYPDQFPRQTNCMKIVPIRTVSVPRKPKLATRVSVALSHAFSWTSLINSQFAKVIPKDSGCIKKWLMFAPAYRRSIFDPTRLTFRRISTDHASTYLLICLYLDLSSR